MSPEYTRYVTAIMLLFCGLLLFTIFTILMNRPVEAQSMVTPVSGVISSDTTWNVENSPYLVTGTVLVDVDVSLTIEAGTEIRFESGKSLVVAGTLLANGTTSQPITFTSALTNPQPGDWHGIRFTDTSEDAEFDADGYYVQGNLLRYIIVEYAGDSNLDDTEIGYAIDALGTAIYVDHSIVRNNQGGGIITGGINGVGSRITSNSVYSNSVSYIDWATGQPNRIGAAIVSLGSTAVISGNTIQGNHLNYPPGEYYGVGGGIISCGNSSIILGNIVAQNTANRAVMIAIGAHGMNVVASDNVVDQNDGDGLRLGYVGSSCLTLYDPDGTSAYRNVIKNNKGIGIRLSAFDPKYAEMVISSNKITNNSLGGVSLENATVRLSHNIISDNLGVGVSIETDEGQIFQNSITNNSGGLVVSFAFPLIFFNDIFDNGAYNLKNETLFDGNHLKATNNWWGTTDNGKIADTIIDWFDDESVGIVDYEPFLTADISELKAIYLPYITKGSWCCR